MGCYIHIPLPALVGIDDRIDKFNHLAGVSVLSVCVLGYQFMLQWL